MDISNTNGKEICHSEKPATFDDSKDFISNLPDPILVHVLSFLPIKDAINTVCIRRFGDLWRSVQVLDFSSCFYHDCEDPDYPPDYLNVKFVDLFRNVLNLHDCGTVDKLCLKFGFAFINLKDKMQQIHGYGDDLEIEKGIADQIEKLICYAIDKKVKVLDLDLKGCNGMYPDECYDMPDVLSSHYLTYLKLSAFDITSCTTINLKSLSGLLLDEVILSDDIMEEIFLGCPFLENLSLADCCGLEKLICRNPNLKKVMVSLDSKEYGLVVISCPYVLSFEIYGWIQHADIVDVSSVVDASIFFNILYWCDQTRDDVVSRLLKMFSRCKTYSLCTWSILFAESKWIEAHEFDGETYLDSQVDATFPCLETIMIYGYVNDSYVIQMAKFLLKSATRLQKFMISTKVSFNGHQFTSEKLQELREKFSSLPRASPEAALYFS